jgi:hypothetical protein
MSWQEVGLKRMLTDWTKDPVRRKHVFWRIVEAWVPHVIVLWYWIGWWAFLTATLCVIGEWLLFEFILERFGLSGWYWERRSEGEITD